MDKRLLREYIDMMVEKIRSKKGVDSKLGNKFDLKKFKSLDNIQICNQYAKTFLDKLGEGSSRAAYLLSGRYVLKIAINDKGLAQNEAEVDVYTNPKSQPIVAKVHGADSGFKWLVSDLVNPLKSPEEFTNLTGVEWETFIKHLRLALKKDTLADDLSDFTKTVIVTARQNKLMVGDLVEVSHWGKTPDGKCALLDYGFTGEVWDKHYSKSAPTPVKSGAPEDKTVKPGAHNNTNKQSPQQQSPANGEASTVRAKPTQKPVVPTEDEPVTVKHGGRKVA